MSLCCVDVYRLKLQGNCILHILHLGRDWLFGILLISRNVGSLMGMRMTRLRMLRIRLEFRNLGLWGTRKKNGGLGGLCLPKWKQRYKQSLVLYRLCVAVIVSIWVENGLVRDNEVLTHSWLAMILQSFHWRHFGFFVFFCTVHLYLGWNRGLSL